MSRPIDPADLGTHLPERVWYLSDDGDAIYCRRPYSFVFSTGEAAAAFARAMELEGVTPVGYDRRDLAIGELLGALRSMQVTRLFIDPTIDPATGDVYGTILRFQEPN